MEEQIRILIDLSHCYIIQKEHFLENSALYKNKKTPRIYRSVFYFIKECETYFTNLISTLLLFALPALLILVSIGIDSPNPDALSLDPETFLELK